jgi:hypothetical protein
MAEQQPSPVQWRIDVAEASCASVLWLADAAYRCVLAEGHSYAHVCKCGTHTAGYRLQWWDAAVGQNR